MRRASRPVVAGFVAALCAAVVLSCTVVGALPARAATDPVVTADSWLRTQIETDGGFELADFAGFETPDAILAVATAAQTGATWNTNTARSAVANLMNGGRSGIGWTDDWSDGTFGTFSAAQAAKLIALVAAPLGIDPRDFDPDGDSASAVDLAAIMDSGRGGDGALPTCNATLFALIADNALRRAPNAATVGYVRAAQKSNGNWDFACDPAGSGVDIDSTSYAVMGLIAAGEPSTSPAIVAAVHAFADAMFATGGWGDDYGGGPQANPNSTALAVLALSAVGVDVTKRTWRDVAAPQRSGEAYVAPSVTLAALQQPDGRIAGPFDDYGINTFATSQAMQGLAIGRTGTWLPQRPNRPVGWPGRWSFATLDGAGGAGRVTAEAPPSPSGVGEDATSVMHGDAPHVFYYDRANGDLRHAWWTGSTWAFETLDGNSATGNRVDGDVGSGAAAMAWAGTPHVFYDDRGRGDLRHAWWTGSTWSFETLDGTGGTAGRVDAVVGASSTTVFAGTPHVFYENRDGGDLRHAWWTGSVWTFETLDGDTTVSGPFRGGRTDGAVGANSSVVEWNGGPHVFYERNDTGDLRHAWWNGNTWGFETLDGDTASGGRVDADTATASAAGVFAGAPHAFYGDATDGTSRHAWWTGTTWAYETLDGAGGSNGRVTGDVALPPTFVLYGSLPHVFYGERSGGDLRHSWWNGSSWNFETLDGVGDEFGSARGKIDADVGRSVTTMQFGSQLQAWYVDANAAGESGGRLRQAWWSPATPDL